MSAELITTKQFVNTNLKAYYRFESGALTTDSSGEGHTLTAISDPAEDASGKFGGAVNLDSTDAYSATDHADFKPTGNFTIGCWVKTSETGTARNIFQSWAKPSSTKYGGVMLRVSTGNKLEALSAKLTGTTVNTDYKIITGGTTITDGTWHFCVFTWDGSYLNLYVDGSSDATAISWVAPVYAATNYVRIGSRNDIGDNSMFFTGSLDDVFLLNGTALSADQIKGIYDGTTNFKLNIGDDWKDADNVYINIGDAWKKVTQALINIGDTWKSIF